MGVDTGPEILQKTRHATSECIKPFKTNDSLVFSWPRDPQNNEILNLNSAI